MTNFCWWLADLLYRTLEPQERDAVHGDFIESGETPGQALCDLLGLVIRRQAALWKGWRPWLTLVGLILPLAIMLSIVARVTASMSATYIWLYANNWDWALLQNSGFWYVLADSVTPAVVSCLTLVCWSWTAGFVLGSVTRRMIPTYAVLFCLALVFGGLVGAPKYLAYLFHSFQRPLSPDESDPISALVFYRQMFPLIVQAVLVAVPSLRGMRQGAGGRMFPPLLRGILWTAAVVSLTLLVTRGPGFGFFLIASSWPPRFWQVWQIRWLHLVAYWPLAYLAASLIWRRWQARTAAI
jgi:hypothetical protein